LTINIKIKKMTYTEKKQNPLSKGDIVTYHDLGNDGHPEKWVEGTVTGVSEDGFNVLWDDFKEKAWEAEYEWANVTIKGDQILENGERDVIIKADKAQQIIEQIN
jgi:hypothetical protein